MVSQTWTTPLSFGGRARQATAAPASAASADACANASAACTAAAVLETRCRARYTASPVDGRSVLLRTSQRSAQRNCTRKPTDYIVGMLRYAGIPGKHRRLAC